MNSADNYFTDLQRPSLLTVVLIALIVLGQVGVDAGPKGGKGKGKGKATKSKITLPFLNVKEHSFTSGTKPHPRGAQITTASHFWQQYRLGYKLEVICSAEGNPAPNIKWFKDGTEFQIKPSAHIYVDKLGVKEHRSKIEIDPATVGDSGIYTCMASNSYSTMAKNFKTEYTY